MRAAGAAAALVAVARAHVLRSRDYFVYGVRVGIDRRIDMWCALPAVAERCLRGCIRIVVCACECAREVRYAL